MTPEERLIKFRERLPHNAAMSPGFQRLLIAEFQAAIEDEREACAKIADQEYVSIQTVTMSDGYPEEGEGDCCADRCLIIRDQIRARGEAKEGEKG